MAPAGRPREVSDETILETTVRVISRVGPTRLTLADVAAEAGLSPATLVQRFGSKRGLLLAIGQQAPEGLARAFADARAATATPLDALFAALQAMPAAITTPEELANHLAFLQIDLSDPEFHAFALQHAEGMRAQIAALLAEAVDDGTLVPSDTERYARAVQTTYNGALTTWAMHREGLLTDWLRCELETLLSPILAG